MRRQKEREKKRIKKGEEGNAINTPPPPAVRPCAGLGLGLSDMPSWYKSRAHAGRVMLKDRARAASLTICRWLYLQSYLYYITLWIDFAVENDQESFPHWTCRVQWWRWLADCLIYMVAMLNLVFTWRYSTRCPREHLWQLHLLQPTSLVPLPHIHTRRSYLQTCARFAEAELSVLPAQIRKTARCSCLFLIFSSQPPFPFSFSFSSNLSSLLTSNHPPPPSFVSFRFRPC